MLGKIGLTVVLTAGCALTPFTTAVSATPLVEELTRMYQPVKANPIAFPGHMRGTVSRAHMTDEQMCSYINESTPGSCIPNADLVDGSPKYNLNAATSTVAMHDVTIDFPGWMSDRDIDKAIQKTLPVGIKYDIWHSAPNGAR
jgi:hypothetical protein